MMQRCHRLLSIIIGLLVITDYTACRSSTASVTATPPPRCAALNQEEYDQAVHEIVQPRELTLNLDIDGMGCEPVYLCNQHYNDYNRQDCEHWHLGSTGELHSLFRYDASYVGANLYGLPPETGLHELRLEWFHPGENYEQLSITLDPNAFSFAAGVPDEQGIVRFTFTYPENWEPSEFGVSFPILGINLYEDRSFSMAEGPYGKLVELVSIAPGEATFDINITAYFHEYSTQLSPFFSAGDVCAVYAASVFDQPAGIFDAIPSDKVDPPYVPTPYACTLEARPGAEPNVNVPGTTPYERVMLSSTIYIPITQTMMGDDNQ